MNYDNHSIFGRLNSETHWYALHTRSRHEKQVNSRLQEKGRKWSDRYKKVSIPLFSCYVFVKICLRDRLSVLQTEGVVSLVSFSGIPAPIPDRQIESLQMIVEKQLYVSPADYFTAGQRVRVIQGPLKGLEGTLMQVKNQSKLIIGIDGIKQAISVEIDPRDLSIIS